MGKRDQHGGGQLWLAQLVFTNLGTSTAIVITSISAYVPANASGQVGHFVRSGQAQYSHTHSFKVIALHCIKTF